MVSNENLHSNQRNKGMEIPLAWTYTVDATKKKFPKQIVIRWTPTARQYRYKTRAKATWQRTVDAELKMIDLAWSKLWQKTNSRGRRFLQSYVPPKKQCFITQKKTCFIPTTFFCECA